jgi:hypothetical protein
MLFLSFFEKSKFFMNAKFDYGFLLKNLKNFHRGKVKTENKKKNINNCLFIVQF